MYKGGFPYHATVSYTILHKDLGDPVVHPPVGEQDRVVGAEDVVVRPVHEVVCQNAAVPVRTRGPLPETEFLVDYLLVRIHFIIEMIGWTGLAPWEPCHPPPSRTSANLTQTPFL